MSDGRTYWQAQDASWWRREWIVALGEEFGPAGPAIINWLECEAKLQNDGGTVKAGPRTVGRGAFVEDLVTVSHVLSRAVTLGLLTDYRESNGRFTCRIVWWQADQGKAMAANRKAKQRGGLPVDPDDPTPLSRSVTPSHGESRSVTECPPTGQDRTEQKKPATQAARKRARQPIDQTVPPPKFPAEHLATLNAVVPILQGVHELRGGRIEPNYRGVGLAMMRNLRCDHVALVRRLEHWLLAGNGQTANTDDIAKRYGDWAHGEPAGRPLVVVPNAGNGLSELDKKRLESLDRLMGQGDAA